MGSGDILPFGLDETIVPTDINSQLDPLLGKRFSADGKEYMLVQCEDAVTSPGGLCFAWGAATDAANHIISLPGTGAADQTIVGVISNDRGLGAIAANDYVLIQTRGRAELTAGAAIGTVGLYLTNGTTTDGRPESSGAGEAATDFARAVDTAASAGVVFTAELLGVLPRS